jgi:hypothetical protein
LEEEADLEVRAGAAGGFSGEAIGVVSEANRSLHERRPRGQI